MGKKKKKKNKISKAQILQSTRSSMSQVASTISSAGPVAQNLTPVFESQSEHKYGGQFDHVKTDMNFFIIMMIMYAVILAVLYFLNNQYGFVLEAGNRMYQFLGI